MLVKTTAYTDVSKGGAQVLLSESSQGKGPHTCCRTILYDIATRLTLKSTLSGFPLENKS